MRDTRVRRIEARARGVEGVAGVVAGVCLAVALSCALGGCSSEPARLSLPRVAATAEAVTQSTVDPGDPAVVEILANGGLLCSGALIGADVVLTAGHCAFQTDPSLLSVQMVSGQIVSVSAILVDPSYDQSALHDIAVLELAAPQSVTPLPILQAVPSSIVGAEVRLVGYGGVSPSDEDPGARRTGTAEVTSLSEYTFALAPDPSLPCFGDSGGPVLLSVGGTEYVAGITSHGEGTCSIDATATRLDQAVRGIFDVYLATGVATRGRCDRSASCASGVCTIAPGALGYCSQGCATTADCPSGMTCATADASATCVLDGAPPGSLGTSCTEDLDCATPMCTHPASSEGGAPDASYASVCGMVCTEGLAGQCPANYDCEQDERGSSSCFAVPSQTATVGAGGGCALARGRSRGGPGAALLIAAALVWRRTRRARGRRGRRSRAPHGCCQ